MSLIFVDVEAGFDSPCPGVGGIGMTEFGAVEFEHRTTFHGAPQEGPSHRESAVWYFAMMEFAEWLGRFGKRPIFISDNPAYDWQWINYYFHKELGYNPFGHSARRIGDFYAGLRGDFKHASDWKKLRVTPHDHNPVRDALGNCEAFTRILAGER